MIRTPGQRLIDRFRRGGEVPVRQRTRRLVEPLLDVLLVDRGLRPRRKVARLGVLRIEPHGALARGQDRLMVFGLERLASRLEMLGKLALALELQPLETADARVRARLRRRLTDLVDRANEALDVAVPARIAQLERVPARQIREIVGQVLGPRHRGPIDQHRNDGDLLVLECRRDFDA